MGVRAYLRSPVALAWTFFAAIAVGAVVAAGWRLADVLTSASAVSDPGFLGGFGTVLVSIFVGGVALAVVAAVWLPCSAAIAAAVGRSIREEPTTIVGTVSVVRRRSRSLFRWAKTRTAVGPIAKRILVEADVSPAEVLVGCDGFVVPALVLDAPTLPAAVERANRVVPQSGREQILATGLGATVILAVGLGAITVGAGSFVPSTPTLAGAAIVFGAVTTAALDVAWRTGVYAMQDLSEGFSR